MTVQVIFALGMGGFIGAIGRFMVSGLIEKILGSSFPYGTLAVNMLGSFIIGYFVLYFQYNLSPYYRAFAVTGFLGALTTFSTFSMETVLMLQNSLYQKALFNVSLNVALSIGATILGMMIFRKIYVL